ncbi:MAG TPA: L-rhamnose/proton symporter RhaT [Armatimonadota bacterium]
MPPNPYLGVFFHWLGGLAAASFYIPYRGVRKWAWETYWLVGGVFSWLVAPLVMASLLVPGFWGVLRATEGRTLLWAFLFGALWGVGGLTFGLSMRYLGIALGYAIALGLCTAFGTLVPPLVRGQMGPLLQESSGHWILLGVAVCLMGIAASGLAGHSKERELTEEQKRGSVSEFNFPKGFGVATLSGVMSACMAFALDAGKPITSAAQASLLAQGRSDLWQGLPVLVVVLWGGFATNFVWCTFLSIRNRTGYQYLNRVSGGPDAREAKAAPLLPNYLFAALAGVTWYFQFFFYTMGQSRMGKYDFSSWTLHMASIITFSTLWGIALKEWRGTSRRTHALIALGLAILIGSTVIVGYGNTLKAGGL